MHVLQLDVTGTPQGFVSLEEATLAYATKSVAWTVGEPLAVMRGGINARTGEQSLIEVHPIVATRGRSRVNLHDYVPPLTNRKLFARDRLFCCWCGQRFSERELTREHIVPLSRGGKNDWQGVASACGPCNHYKGNRLASELGWQLVYLPYVPSLFEDLLLQGRRIRADVHEWLASRLPRGSRLQ